MSREQFTSINAMSFDFDVFLSHSSKDKPVVREIAARLKKDCVRVWFDEEQIKPGDSIPAKIEEGLERSRVLVLCMSANAFGSDWAQLESGTFRFRDPLNKDRRFLPLRLDEAPIKGYLAQFLYINWRSGALEEEYARLREACRPPARPLTEEAQYKLIPNPSATSGNGPDRTAKKLNRFHIALSFPNEHRPFVLKVAMELAAQLTRDKIFYDEWYEAELLGTGGDLKLLQKYQNSDLIVPFFSQHYSKAWCQLEWQTIRSILLTHRKDDAVIPVHLDDTQVEGWFEIDFGIRLKGRSEKEIAALILQAFFLRHEYKAGSLQTKANEIVQADIGKANPTEEDRRAAWTLLIEMDTGIVGQEVVHVNGKEKLVLNSLFSFFPLIRNSLRQAGPTARQFAEVAIQFLNVVLHPFASNWHEKLIEGAALSPEAEQLFRVEFDDLRNKFFETREMFAQIAGTSTSRFQQHSPEAGDPSRPSDADRRAAWSLLIEMDTRIVRQEVVLVKGKEKVVFNSVMSLFSLIRDLLRQAGPAARQFAELAIPFLNNVLRPFASNWHEKLRDDDAITSEAQGLFRVEFGVVRNKCSEFRGALAKISGAS